jgi:hypothetical protein
MNGKLVLPVIAVISTSAIPVKPMESESNRYLSVFICATELLEIKKYIVDDRENK